MKIFLVIQVVFYMFFQKDEFLFLKGHNLEINSDVCVRQGEYVVCEMQKGQNKISLDVVPLRCDVPYNALVMSWVENDQMQSQMIEIKRTCMMYLPNVQSSNR